MVGKAEVLPDKFVTKYESVIVSGEVEEVFDHEKQTALEGLLHKYSSKFIEKGKKPRCSKSQSTICPANREGNEVVDLQR